MRKSSSLPDRFRKHLHTDMSFWLHVFTSCIYTEYTVASLCMLFTDSLKPRLRLGKKPLSSQLPVSAVDRPRTFQSQHLNVTILLLGECPGLYSMSTLPIDRSEAGMGRYRWSHLFRNDSWQRVDKVKRKKKPKMKPWGTSTLMQLRRKERKQHKTLYINSLKMLSYNWFSMM